jgi:hypothetical protein
LKVEVEILGVPDGKSAGYSKADIAGRFSDINA